MNPEELKELLGDYVVFVEEPEYSRSQLLRLQQKYGMGTKAFQWTYGTSRVDWPGPEEDRREWLHWAEMFTLAGGRIEEVDPEARDAIGNADPSGPESSAAWDASEAPGVDLLGASALGVGGRLRLVGLRVA